MNVTATRFATHVRTWLLIAALTGLLITIGAALGGAALYLFVVFAVGMNLVGYWFSDRIALAASRARPLAPEQAVWLQRIVEDLAHRAETPVPRLYLIPSEQPNTFATGRNPRHAAIAVTEGLVEQLPADQIKGVLAHEFAHIKNHDTLLSSIAAMVAGAVASILQISTRFNRTDDDGSPLGFLGTLVAIIVAPIAAMLLQLGVSREREYLADASGAQLLGRAAPLADALENLERGARAIPMNVNPAAASLYAVNPLARHGVATLFMTHPPIARRIRRLRALDGNQVVALAA
jgi:heat shock protein HtpX